jgi:beta-lactam-binding protein with PASTA domain
MNVYEITVPAERMRLGDGRGQLVFSVTNRSGVAQQVNADIAPSGETRKEWLALSGESPRTLSAGGTDQFIVAARFPPDTPRGTYPFRLRVSSANSRTSEDAAESPIVYFDATGSGTGKSTWWIWVAAAVLLVVAGVVGYLVVGNRGPRMPDVVNKDGIEAIRAVQARKYITHVAFETNPAIAAGRVIRTEPPAETRLNEDTSVRLTIARSTPGAFELQGEDARQLSDSTAQRLAQFISAGNEPPPRPRMPDVVNKDVIEAIHAVQARKYITHLAFETNPAIAAGRVIRTEPPAETKSTEDTSVRLTIARSTPGAFELQEDDARQLSDSTAQRLAQFIAAGNEPPPAPDVAVPAVVGSDAVHAMLKLQEVGLTAKLVTFSSSSETPNQVVQQDPISPATLPKGAAVTIFVAQRPFIFVPVNLSQIQLSPMMRTEVKKFNQFQGKARP